MFDTIAALIERAPSIAPFDSGEHGKRFVEAVRHGIDDSEIELLVSRRNASCSVERAIHRAGHARAHENTDDIITLFSGLLENALDGSQRWLARRRDVSDHLVYIFIERINGHGRILVLHALPMQMQRDDIDIVLIGNVFGYRSRRIGHYPYHGNPLVIAFDNHTPRKPKVARLFNAP